jgi:phosphoribosyl-ATP pyrophosphohydrolase
MSIDRQPLTKLERTIASRAAKPNPKSYTSKLLAGGVAMIGAKVTEEAAEVVEAAGEPGDAGREHFVREVGDLVYHLLVLMQHRSTTLADLETELARRFGVSGIEEKASRKSADSAASSGKAQPAAAAPVSRKKASTKAATKTKSKPKVKKKATAARKVAKKKRK